MLGSGISASAAVPNTQKDENVYANLNQDGSVDGIYVVNAYLLDKETDIVDYGKYDSVKNLTIDEELTKKGDTITTTAPAGNFFYQGNLKTKEMPGKSPFIIIWTEKRCRRMNWPERTEA